MSRKIPSKNTGNDTIAAVATPPGRAGVAILRLSGPLVPNILKKVLGRSIPKRHASFSRFHSVDQIVIDQGIALFFPAPDSFTGESVLELHMHGNPVLTDWMMETLIQLGARQARPGEFSERAFLNGKMDLAEAEATCDLIHAASRQAARNALRSLQGVFSEQVRDIQSELTALRLRVEAGIDFPEEETGICSVQIFSDALYSLLDRVNTLEKSAMQGSRLCEGIMVVIAGPPNAGKSSLMNRLSGREASIVTDRPGTTRDVLREPVLLAGVPVLLADTAGMHAGSSDPIEQEGMRRAKAVMQAADIVLYLEDVMVPGAACVENVPGECLFVRNKIDLSGESARSVTDEMGRCTLYLSVHTGEGVDRLKEEICRVAGCFPGDASENGFSARRRHLDALARTAAFLSSAASGILLDCMAEELRLAQQALSEITGELTPDDLLGKIFSTFCIGK